MTGLSVRRATEGDLPTLVALLADDALGAAREDSGALAPYRAALAAIAANPEDGVFLAEREGAVVGCFQLTFLPGLSHRGAVRGQIETVRVAAARRGAGIGEAMLGWAVARCRERGCRLVQLTTDLRRPGAHRFYERLGFVASHAGMKLDLTGGAHG